MLLPVLITLLLQFSAVKCQAVDAYGISLYDKLEVMERMMLAQAGVDVSVNPCSNFRTGAPILGEVTSAEWVRIVFHDFVTADVAAGTGGLDASIGFETARAENVGVHFINDTLGVFAPFYSVYTSMADIIALGLMGTLISCDPVPRVIKMRVGRTDAAGPGPSGVPTPTDDLTTTLAQFAQAGFSQSEAIGSVACGHSLGAVHRANFPDIVPASVVGQTNLDGGSNFDSSPAVFDNTVVNEYLNGTGKAGGPLVVGFNSTTNSDLRLYTSDNNATIGTMTSAQAFQDTCYTLFEKMIDTVPSSVTLSDVIVPRTWTMQQSALDLTSSGEVFFSGSITWNSLTDTSPTTAQYTYTGGSSNTETLNSITGVSRTRHGFGTITSFTFNDTLNDSSINQINIMDGLYTAPINQTLFILPSRTFRWGSAASPTAPPIYLIRAAILTSLLPSTNTSTLTIYHPTKQPGTLSPTMTTTSSPMASFATAGSYSLLQGTVSVGSADGPGINYFDVQVGGLRTSKISDNIGSCTNAVITTC